jgi:hypothetical protein
LRGDYLLPSTTKKAIKTLYATDFLPVSASADVATNKKSKKEKKATTAVAVVAASKPAVRTNRDGDEVGETWFHVCSQLKGCLYLSKTSAGSEFELRPRISNVCKALGIILADNHNWNSMKDLERFWNNHIGELLGISGGNIRTVECDDSVISFRAPHSDTEMVHREQGRIRFLQRRHELLLELEDAHGLATVKHGRFGGEKAVQSILPWEDNKLFAEYLQHWKDQGSQIRQSRPEYLATGAEDNDMRQSLLVIERTLNSVLLADQLLPGLSSQSITATLTSDMMKVQSLTCALLSACWGSETEVLADGASVDSHGRLVLQLQSGGGPPGEAAKKALGDRAVAAFRLVVRAAIDSAKRSTAEGVEAQEQKQYVQLLCWVLNRCISPIAGLVSEDGVMTAMLRLPPTILNDVNVKFVIISLDERIIQSKQISYEKAADAEQGMLPLVLYGNGLRDVLKLPTTKMTRAMFVLLKARLF